MLKFGIPTIALPLAIKNVLFRLDALYMYDCMYVYIATYNILLIYNYCV